MEVTRFLQVSTPISSQILFLSPLQTMASFREDGTTRDATALPYAAMVGNGVAWCAYGALASPAPDSTILLSNLGGVAFGLYYCFTFSKYMSRGSNAPAIFAGMLTVVGAIIAAALALPTETAHELTGFTGVAFSLIMTSGPLASIRAVLRDCSASSLPMGFTLAAALTSGLWASYGLLVIDDPLVYGPNVVGLIASATQLLLYARFGDNEEGCALYY